MPEASDAIGRFLDLSLELCPEPFAPPFVIGNRSAQFCLGLTMEDEWLHGRCSRNAANT